MIEPGTSRSFSTVQLIEQVSEGKYDYNKATVVDPSKYNDDAFSDLDQIIKSKIALSEDYKAKTKVSFGVMKQCQLLLEKLTYTPNTNNYWMEEYVPFFTDLQKKDYFEPYAYYIMGSVNNDDLQKEISKNKRKITEFTDWAGKYIALKRDKRDVTVNGVKKTMTYIYYENNLPEAFGEENAKGKSIGDWVIYNEYSGNIEAKGTFNSNGNREGEWVYYYYDGTMKERSHFVDGKHEGTSEIWYKNGAIKDRYNYKNDKLNGEVSEYNTSGILSTHGSYVNDKPIGPYALYYSDGKQHYTATYIEAGLDGDLKEYYLDGQVSVASICKNGKKTGTS
ncbi:MAG TPA: toxin-antitoxin system YwqK family antitoxin, partial [Bacteroidia bacterium]|nr:toxin-antitoxin system YwqK family antitoxin [Bacteroidia bacterium]